MAKRRAGGLTTLALVLLAIGVTVFFARDVTTAYVSYRLESASSPQSELEAATRLDRWAHGGWTRGFSVTAEDAHGLEVRPWVTGDYDAVHVVEIRFDNGMHVRRPILNRLSLGAIFAH